MNRNTYVAAAAAMAIGLAASACGHAANPASTPTSTATAAQLQSLIPTPANTQRTDGPASIADNGIHLHYLVNGGGNDVLNAYKTALEGKGWTVTVITSGGWGASGGATYTGTQGNTYGVFGGGGNGTTTDVSACAWPAKPANPNCGGTTHQ
jgi:hypothetical protein